MSRIRATPLESMEFYHIDSERSDVGAFGQSALLQDAFADPSFQDFRFIAETRLDLSLPFVQALYSVPMNRNYDDLSLTPHY
jgi:hypothetical protein